MSGLPGEVPASERKKRPFTAFLVSAVVSLILVWLLMRGLSWRRLGESLLSASPWRLALYALIGLFTLWLRAVRFRMALPDPKPGSGPVFCATAIQNALGDLVPARLASFGSYIWVMNRRFSVATESAAATFLVSFIFDLLTLGPLLLLAAAVRFGLAGGSSQFSPSWIVAFAVFFLVAAAAATWWLAPLVRLAGMLPRALAQGRTHGGWARVAAFLDRVADALGVVRRSGMMSRLLGMSLAIRAAKYAALFALTESLLVGAGYTALRPNVWDLIIGISATELIATLPIPALGQFGVWEGGMVGALLMMGFAREPATLVAFGVHGITTAFEYVLASLAFTGLFFLSKKPNDVS